MGGNASGACFGSLGNRTVYTAYNRAPVTNGDPIYSNTSLTSFASGGWYSTPFLDRAFWSGTAWSSLDSCGS